MCESHSKLGAKNLLLLDHINLLLICQVHLLLWLLVDIHNILSWVGPEQNQFASSYLISLWPKYLVKSVGRA